jgi:hypothetical protein
LTATPGQFTSKDLHTAQWRTATFDLVGGKNSYPCYSQDENGNASNPIYKKEIWFCCGARKWRETCGPLALITKAHESDDKKVRKVELVTATDGIKRSYTRPVNEVILLRNEDELNPKP